jgi:hypothetical protein
MSNEEPSYIDYEAFLDPSFSAASFANTLVLNTNNPSDTPLDLSTPLSRVLFDVQEIDTHIDSLTTKSALPLLNHVKDNNEASARIVKEVDAQVASLTDSYKRLEKEVLQRYEAAEEVRRTSERLWQTVKLGRSVGRCLQMGRQLEIQMTEVQATGKKEDHRAMVRASNTLLSLRSLIQASGPGEEGEGLGKVNVVNTLRKDLLDPSERTVRNKASQIVREFSLSNLSNSSATNGTSTFAQTEDTKSRTISALTTLYLLSTTLASPPKGVWEPDLMISALQDYLRTALTSSLASLARSLSTLPTLDRTLLEVSSRCQNIVALEVLLESIHPATHPLLAEITPPNFLQPLLHSLETSSLPSYFWRTLAGGLSGRVQEIISKGGVSARTLKSNKNAVKDAIRDCVVRGSQPPAGAALKGKTAPSAGWEREIAVMVGSVIGNLGR